MLTSAFAHDSSVCKNCEGGGKEKSTQLGRSYVSSHDNEFLSSPNELNQFLQVEYILNYFIDS